MTKRATAEAIADFLRPVTVRIEIAGALRRGAPFPKDIDIVCVPISEQQLDLFGNASGETQLQFWARITELVDELGLEPQSGGEHVRKLWCPDAQCQADIFITTLAQWGAIFAIRTGPADFTKLCVTPRGFPAGQGGAMPRGMKQEHGRLWRTGDPEPLSTPEEEMWFAAIGVPCWRPEDRSFKRLREHLEKRRAGARR